MAQQCEAFPAQRVGDVEHRMQRTGERVIRARRQVRAAAVAGQVGLGQVDARADAFEFHRQRHEAGGVVRSEEHTSELQSLMRISYAVFCLKKKKLKNLNALS